MFSIVKRISILILPESLVTCASGWGERGRELQMTRRFHSPICIISKQLVCGTQLVDPIVTHVHQNISNLYEGKLHYL